MPHQDYLRRLIDDETSHSPASSGGRDDLKPRHTHLGNRALTALAIDLTVSSSEETDEASGDDTPRAVSTPPTPQYTRNSPPPTGRADLNETLQKLRNAKALGIGLPGDVEEKRFSSGAIRSFGCFPPNKIANAQYADRTSTNGVASSNDDGLSAKPVMLGGPARNNIGLNRQLYNIGLYRHSHNIGVASSPNTGGPVEGSVQIDVKLSHDEHHLRSRYDGPASPSAVAVAAFVPNAAAEPSGQSEQLASAEKSTATLVCLLTGSLSCTTRDNYVCHIIRGFWEYENSNQYGDECKSFQALGSNRFELYRKISSDIVTSPLTEGGIFKGSFAYRLMQKGRRGESCVVHENIVIISFSKRDDESQSYSLTGTGRNQVGEFRLIGTALRTTSGDSYNLLCRKEYTELFQLQQPSPDVIRNEYTTLLPTNQDENGHESRKKLKTTKKQSASGGSGDCEGNSCIIRPTPETRAIVDRTALFISKNGRALAKAILNSEKGRTLRFDFLHDTSPFHAYYEDRIRFYDEKGTDEQETRKQKERQETERRVMNVESMPLSTFTSPGDSTVAHDVDSSDDESDCSVEVDSSTSPPAPPEETAHRKIHQETASGKKTFATANTFLTSACFNEIGAPAAQRHSKTMEDTIEEIKKNDVQEDFYDMDGIPYEDQVHRYDNNTQSDQVPLETILGSHWASVLESHCRLKTAKDLYDANGEEIINNLIGVIGTDFQGCREKDIKLITKGLLYGWYIQVKEVLHLDESISEITLPTPQRKNDGGTIQSILPACSAFMTPLSYVDLQFIKFQGIKSDAELSQIDPSHLAHSYAVYLGETYKEISLTDAFEITTKWRQRARFALGMISSDVCDNPQITRLAKVSIQQEIMHTVSSLSKTSPDEENCGLPRRSIFTHDTRNNVLYEFLITVGDSTCSDSAGRGAFLTFKGAKVLKEGREWKKRGHIPQRKTRNPLEASFSNTCGVSVSLGGRNLHGDEHHYGPEHDGSIGLYREYTLDDFVDIDNITFSSNHEDCGLVELESRYAPLIPADRKTDLVFSVKDFIFSNEPSSWRYDVTEKLHGQPQVVDFTDDTTGAPHEIAKSHLSMYVNEVGYNMGLAENVVSLSRTPRSVTYYIYITKPLAKGQKVELLTNYKEQYESMRERKGYGRSNLFDGAKSDSDDVARVRRNLDDRFLLEESILTYSEDDILQVTNFIHGRVWSGLSGVEAATSAHKAGSKEDETNLLRQCIARRRLDWLCRRLRIRFLDLNQDPSLFLLPNDVYVEGMYIIVHDWPNVKTIPRPPYTGLATINSITKDKHGRPVFEVSTLDNKYIEAVPEAVVTHPTDDDFKGVPSRVYSSWKKWKRQQELPGERLRVLSVLDTLKWDPFFLETLTSSSCASSGMQANIVDSLTWEFAEEILFFLAKDKRLTHPFDETMWCPFSVSLLKKCVFQTATFLLMGRDKQILCQKLEELAFHASKALKEIINKSASTPLNVDICDINKTNCVENLAFKYKVNSLVLVVESIHINELRVEDYLFAPMPLDFDWYLINQIIFPIHAVASLIDWDGKHYSLENIFDQIDLDIDAYAEFFRQKVHGWHPLIEM